MTPPCPQVQILRERSPAWKPTFIVKPDGGCQGGGIYLVQEPTDVRLSGSLQSRPAVVQEYIARPLLLEKLKFDLRLYVLLRSLEPLEVYVAKEGLSRFCTEPYQEPALRNLHRVFMHLTNYSLNVHSGGFVHSDSGSTGSKRSLSSVLGRLAEGGVDVRKLWSEILALVVKTVIALVPELKVHHQADIPSGKPGPSCFQVSFWEPCGEAGQPGQPQGPSDPSRSGGGRHAPARLLASLAPGAVQARVPVALGPANFAGSGGGLRPAALSGEGARGGSGIPTPTFQGIPGPLNTPSCLPPRHSLPQRLARATPRTSSGALKPGRGAFSLLQLLFLAGV